MHACMHDACMYARAHTRVKARQGTVAIERGMQDQNTLIFDGMSDDGSTPPGTACTSVMLEQDRCREAGLQSGTTQQPACRHTQALRHKHLHTQGAGQKAGWPVGRHSAKQMVWQLGGQRQPDRQECRQTGRPAACLLWGYFSKEKTSSVFFPSLLLLPISVIRLSDASLQPSMFIFTNTVTADERKRLQGAAPPTTLARLLRSSLKLCQNGLMMCSQR